MLPTKAVTHHIHLKEHSFSACDGHSEAMDATGDKPTEGNVGMTETLGGLGAPHRNFSKERKAETCGDRVPGATCSPVPAVVTPVLHVELVP